MLANCEAVIFQYLQNLNDAAHVGAVLRCSAPDLFRKIFFDFLLTFSAVCGTIEDNRGGKHFFGFLLSSGVLRVKPSEM